MYLVCMSPLCPEVQYIMHFPYVGKSVWDVIAQEPRNRRHKIKLLVKFFLILLRFTIYPVNAPVTPYYACPSVKKILLEKCMFSIHSISSRPNTRTPVPEILKSSRLFSILCNIHYSKFSKSSEKVIKGRLATRDDKRTREGDGLQSQQMASNWLRWPWNLFYSWVSGRKHKNIVKRELGGFYQNCVNVIISKGQGFMCYRWDRVVHMANMQDFFYK